jgi:hypothetical protein
MKTPIYIPIFRYRPQEKDLLINFEFGEHIYPYVEIYKKRPINSPPPKPNPNKKPKEPKKFHEHYLPTLNQIKSEKVFVDLPVHLVRKKKMPDVVIEFLLSVIEKREERTKHILSLSACEKMIPVISTYSQIGSGEADSIRLQEIDLRPTFNTLAFRTSEKTLASDLLQVEAIAKPQDYLFIDLEELCLGNEDDMETAEFLMSNIKTFNKCTVVLINSPLSHTLTNSGLDHGQIVKSACNLLPEIFSSLGAQCFADYAGVKKDLVEEGGMISPGLLFYDPVENDFYGFRGRKWEKDEKRNLDDIRGMILQDLLTSDFIPRMKESHLEYLGAKNEGWNLVKGMWDETIEWRYQPRLKRISMEHYLHCMRTKILAGCFQN